MGLPKLEQSLCGCSLRTGSKIIGWLTAIVSVLEVIIVIIGVAVVVAADDSKLDHNTKMGFELVAAVIGVIALLNAILCIFMLVGVYKERPSYIYPWIIVNLIIIVLSVIGGLITLFSIGPNPDSASKIVGALIHIYLVLIVNSYYVDLTSGQGGRMTC